MTTVWWRFLRAAMPGLFLTVGAVVGSGVVLMGAQALALSPVLPGPRGALQVLLGHVPAALAIGLPVGVLVGVVSATRSWLEGGELLGLELSGRPRAGLALPAVLLGLAGGGVQLGITHVLEPAGRAAGTAALHAATAELRLRPEQTVSLGPVLLHVQAVEGAELADIFVAAPGVVAAARSGRLARGERLLLHEGTALSDGSRPDDPAWSLRFEAAEVSLSQGGRRVELAERTSADLLALIDRMQASGRAARAERLAWLKRTLVPLCVPLLALLALPLGARGVQPGLAAGAVVLGWWTLMRIGDQAVHALGPVLAAGLPALGLVLALVLAWSPRLRP